MQVAISGSHGLIGSALRRSLEADGHRVQPIVRGHDTGPASSGPISYDPARRTLDPAALAGVDAVVNLAGAPIASGPLTANRRQSVRESRLAVTEALAGALAQGEGRPKVLVSGSAVGYYGVDRGDEILDERAGAGEDFLARLCLDWEAATKPAADAGVRTVCVRTGIVLAAHGGALKAQLPLFKLGLGGPAGPGTQWMSWIALHDEVSAIRFLLEGDLDGPVNLAAPNPVRNAEFVASLGKALHRPARLRVPAFLKALPLGFGDLVENLLLASQRVTPKALTDAGFSFAHPHLEPTLRELVT